MKIFRISFAVACLAVLGVGGTFAYYSWFANPRVERELLEDPDGERAREVMLVTLPSGRRIPVNYWREGDRVYAGADGGWWRELAGEGEPVVVLIRGEELRGVGRAVEDDPEHRKRVFDKLRPDALPWFGTLVEIRLAGPPSEEVPDIAAAAGRLAPFKRALMQALTRGLAEGPVAAIDACRVEAPRIAIAQQEAGLRVGRASHRLRNPANRAPDWAAPILAGWVSGASAPEPELVNRGAAGVGYVEPIFVQPPCLACHGASLAPEVSERIAEHYPADEATGFAVGDLRGLFWLELPAS